MVNAPVLYAAEDSFSSDEEEDEEMIRAKWMLDGCCTLDEVVQALRSKIREVEEARRQGWELTGRIEDDYGFMRKIHACACWHPNPEDDHLTVPKK